MVIRASHYHEQWLWKPEIVLKPVCFLQFLSSQGDHCWNQKTFRGDMGLERVSVDAVGTLMHWTSGGEFCGLTLVTLPFLCSRGQPCPVLWGCHLLKCVNNKGHRHNPRHWPVPCRQLQPSFSAVSDSYVAAQLLHCRGEGTSQGSPTNDTLVETTSLLQMQM